MYSCKLCMHSSTTICAFERHMRVHRHVSNVTFSCALPDCNRTFHKFEAFKTHSYRHGKGKTEISSRSFASFDLTCHVELCRASCETLKSLYRHLKTHIKEGKTVSCPFQGCGKVFSSMSTFTAH